MAKLQQLIRYYPLTTFFILAYALSWWPAIPTGGQLLPYGPALAAVIVLAVTAGRSGLADLWRQMTHWRVGGRWYISAVGIIIVIHFGASTLNLLLGATAVNNAQPRVGGVLLELLLLGGEWEEPGWSGYALPRLQERFADRPAGPLIAALILGLLRAGWHLPLVLYGHIFWYDALFLNLAFQLIIAWLYNCTNGSVLVVMLFHLTSNIVGGGIIFPSFAGVDRMRYYWLCIALQWLIVLAILWRAGPRLGMTKGERK